MSKSKKTWASRLAISSMWRLKSPAIMILLYEVSSVANATIPYCMFKTSVNTLGNFLDYYGLFVDKC